MITVDIKIPVINQVYDFSLDENAEIHSVISEIAFIVSDLVQPEETVSFSKFSLYSYDHKKILAKTHTLSQCGIQSGERLIIV